MEKGRLSWWLAALDPRRVFGLVSGLLLAGTLSVSLAGCGYNDVVDRDEQVKASWAEVQNQYKRRADLVPNLVSVVKGAGQFEQDTLTKVVEARSKVAGLKVDSSTIDDPEKLKKFEAAQNELGGSLSRLLVVAEQYPQLKATGNIGQLQEELTSTENKVSFARQLYNDTATEYNTKQQQFPTTLVAGLAKAQPADLWEIEDQGERAVPKVDLSSR